MKELTVVVVTTPDGGEEPDTSFGEQNVTLDEDAKILRWSLEPLPGVVTALYTYRVKIYEMIGEVEDLLSSTPEDYETPQSAREIDISSLPTCTGLIKIEIHRFRNNILEAVSIIIEKTIICGEIFRVFKIVINIQKKVFDLLIKAQMKTFTFATKIIKRRTNKKKA